MYNSLLVYNPENIFNFLTFKHIDYVIKFWWCKTIETGHKKPDRPHMLRNKKKENQICNF